MRQGMKEFGLSSCSQEITVKGKCHIAVSTVSDEANKKGE